MERPRSLASLPAGSRAVVAQIPQEDLGLAADLAALRILPGEAVEVVEVIPLGGPILIQAGGSPYALGRDLAGRVTVVEAS
ncbi:MAG: ferrous iron transport protein A [Armatimonadetes bacterium]|nr:ferrous iron transport protein A [Armatimonadota bacterium]